MDREFPSNAQRARKTAAPSPRGEQKERVARVAQGRVIRRKKPLGRKFFDMFGGDARGAGSYVMFDILIPAAKDAIVDGFTMGIERMVFGESSGRRGRRPGGGGIFQQNHAPHRTNYQQPTSIRQPISPRGRANFQFDEILLESRVEGDEIIATLIERIEQYGAATVRDLYDALGEESKWTEEKYGWVDLSYARVHRARGGGYLLDLPKPEPLE
jgi:hypothetical protein